MRIKFTTTIDTTAGRLAEALWDCSAADVVPGAAELSDNGHWYYKGTRRPVRIVSDSAPVRLIVVARHDLEKPHRGVGVGFVRDDDGGWIAERFGSLSARACKLVVGRL